MDNTNTTDIAALNTPYETRALEFFNKAPTDYTERDFAALAMICVDQAGLGIKEQEALRQALAAALHRSGR